ncbi:hypothetical protein ACFW1A_16015 [Kitasatospora sp. NPDC058965]|uniref:hypothetical protein n=1 Tax=Kitasatospora sp. NPDC058965 TaxID=3346682 RepID=UPI0036B2785A
MSPDRLGPLGDRGLWQQVTAAAAGRCQCRGACGRPHIKPEEGGRCPHRHGGYRSKHGSGAPVRLLAAPADPAALLWPPHRQAALPGAELAAWCPDCHSAATTRARKTAGAAQPATGPDALFEI